ncbi:TetR/AcrR family transcriptional regulator [Aquimarina sp. RZ0]|uniref:TetR/AcrR family transcriptional regulator n=1 Tax=Aquimarina sp. RZ0 TaxID=2607730 RepID=UPI0011F3DF34|nr:TetR/AcrR family transcriptional regulator [Aquimarina sp. RZ0]KAA1245082.1 TetR/AcrR family transcriptional regulator [Aquimarina sp. RZ0]
MPKVETFDRNQVLLKATEIFQKKGYNGTSMQDLVDVTNLNRSSIYNSFGCKLGIFMEVLSFYKNDIDQSFEKELIKTYNTADAIKVIFEITLKSILEDDDKKGCLLVNCTSEMANQEPIVHSFVEKNQDKMIAMIEDIINKGQLQKIFNEKQTASQYALYLFTSLQGLRMTGILNKNEEELRNLVNNILYILY